MEHTNKIAIQILKKQYSDYPENAWHYDDQYKMIVEEIELSSLGGEEKTLEEFEHEDFWRQLFKNSSNCYADTRTSMYADGDTEGEVIQAITEDRFIDILKENYLSWRNSRVTVTPNREEKTLDEETIKKIFEHGADAMYYTLNPETGQVDQPKYDIFLRKTLNLYLRGNTEIEAGEPNTEEV